MRRTDVALSLGIVAALAVAGAAAAWSASRPDVGRDDVVTIDIRYSRFVPGSVTVPMGVPVTIVLRNDDPIDHEWIVGDEAVHERHRTGTEPVHGARPTEVSVPAGASRRTTVVFESAGSLRFVCHLPGHEAYGMSGVLIAAE